MARRMSSIRQADQRAIVAYAMGHDLDEEHMEIYSGEYGPREMREMVMPGLASALRLALMRKVLWGG